MTSPFRVARSCPQPRCVGRAGPLVMLNENLADAAVSSPVQRRSTGCDGFPDAGQKSDNARLQFG